MSIPNQQVSEKSYQKYAWIILFVLAILLASSSLFIAISAGADMSDFEASTGVQWSDLSAQQPDVALYIVRLFRLIGVGFTGFTLFSAVIVWTGYRTGEQRAWIIMWLFPIFLGLTTLVFFTANAAGLGMFYGLCATVAVLGMLLPYRKFFPQEHL